MPSGADDGGAGPHVSDARRRLEAIRSSLLREMTERLSRLDQSGGRLVSEQKALDNARRIRGEVLELLREDGLPVTVGIAESRVVDAVDAALRLMPRAVSKEAQGARIDVTFDAEAKASLARSVSGVLDEVALAFKEAALEIRKAIDVGVNTGSSLKDVTEDVAKALQATFNRSANVVDTAIRMAAQKAILDKGQAAADELGVELVWEYSGTSDLKTRPFCARSLGKAFTRAAMNALENDSGLPAATARGGFNCRHFWTSRIRDEAEAEGIEVVDG